MNIHQIKFLFIVICTAFIATSCNKMLDIHPKDLLEDEQIYASVENFESAVLGVYAGTEYEYTILFGSVFADENRISADNMGVDGYASNLYRWGYATDDDVILAAWKCGFESIYRTNTLLENIHRLPADSDPQKVDQLKAELKGLRSFLHFGLHQIYGQYDLNSGRTIPYLTHTNINGRPGKMATAAFFDMAWKDLETALNAAYLPTEKHRFNKDALMGFAARFFLYKGDYEQAIRYAEPLARKYHLVSDEDYLSIWKDRTDDEIIFRLKRNQANEIRPNTLWRNYGSGKTMFYPSNKFLKHLEADGGIRAKLFDTEDADESDEDFAPIAKYAGNSYTGNVNDPKVLRAAEIYLILAEAYSQGNAPDQQKAMDWINVLRGSRDVALITKPLEIADILHERLLELAFEGHRYFDLKRLGKPIERMPEDLALTTDKNRLDFSDPLYWIPIPFREVQVNPNLR